MMLKIRYALLKAAVVLMFLSFNPLALWSQMTANAATNDENTLQTANWKTIKREKHLTIRVNPNANTALYGPITVGSVTYTGPASKLKPRESDKLVALLHDSLVNDLATKPSPDTTTMGTLTLHANITKVKRSHPWINVVTIAAVFVPLDLGRANVTAQIVDESTGQVIAEIETVGCGQIYQVLGSLQPLGQSKIVLKKQSRSIAREVTRMYHSEQSVILASAVMPLNK